MKFSARQGVWARILIPVSGLIIVPWLSTVSLIDSSVRDQMENAERAQLVATGAALRGLVSERARRLTADTVLLAADFALKRAVATYDPDTLATVAVDYRERIDVELLWITDESGNLLGDASGHQRAGRAIGNLPALHAAITEGHEATALNELDGTLFIFVAVPVLAPDPIGFLLVGSAIDDDTARAWARRIGSTVTLATTSRVLTTSWPAAERDDFFPGGQLRPEAWRPGDHDPFLVQRGEAHLLSLLVPIESSLSTPLWALLQQPYDRTFPPLHAVLWRVGLFGAAALAAALMLGALVAGSIAASLRSEGDDLPASTPLAAEIDSEVSGPLRRWT
jgi:adenylate cyclase